MSEFALQIDNLKKTYKGGTVALKGISLKVKKGDFYALLGPNGAGKSSTIGIIGTLVTKTSGQVKIFDIDTDKQLHHKKYADLIGQRCHNYIESSDHSVLSFV